MSGPLLRYRAIAWVVGVVLLILVLVAVPLKYVAGDPGLVATVGPIHGFLFIAYVLLTFDLARHSRWPLMFTLLVMVAGTVPFLSFVAEHKVMLRERERL